MENISEPSPNLSILENNKIQSSINQQSIVQPEGVLNTKDDGILDNNEDEKEVQGANGQLCSSQKVLDEVEKRYTHINTNTFRGGANGKIKAEFMRCDCQYNPCTILLN